MYPLRSAVRAEARRSTLQRAAHATTSSSLATASTRRIAHGVCPTVRLSRSLHSSLTSLDKKWINQKGNEKASTILKNDKEKEKSKMGEKITPSVSVTDKGDSKDGTPESSLPDTLPEENGVADEEQSRPPANKPPTADETTSRSSSSSASATSGNSAASSSSTASTPPSSSGGSDGSSGKSSTNAITKLSIPEIYPQVLALPITRRPLFPGFYKAVTITSPPVIKAIRTLLQRGQPYIGAFLLKDSESDSDVINSPDQVYPVGVFAQITSVFGSSDNPAGTPQGQLAAESEGDKKPETLTAVLYPHRRIRIDELLTGPNGPSLLTPQDIIGESASSADSSSQQKPESEVASFEKEDVPSPEQVAQQLHADGSSASALRTTGQKTDESKEPAAPHSSIEFLHSLIPQVSIVNVSNLQLEPYKKDSQIVRAVMSELISVFKDIAQLAPIFREQITSFTMSQSTSNVFDEPDKLADFAAAVSTGEVTELQAVLESLSIEDRLQKALLILKKELINAQLQSKISKDVESKIQKRQREYYLMEQLKGIKKELGMESDGKDKLVERFKEKASQLAMPEGVKKVFDEEINKLMHLEPAASEFNVTRNYLDWLTQIPWGVHSPENFDIQHAIKVLDEDHYGLKDVKDRILEFLAVGKLRGTVEGKIICMVGPPGVGKTSIGKSIARALDRQFYRFSVGGLTDVAEIKGHRRTYVGAMPGKSIQALKKVGTENPLILIDEVDKIGRGHNGDPSSALLEMLDPEQNSSFLDHYMDVPVDLSRVLFVCTANVLDTIPAPLLDRMEVLEVSGYVSEEKIAIAERYLSPQAKEASGLKDTDISLEPEAIAALIRYYCRESGVRNLKKHIDKIYRKAAYKIVSDLGESALPEPQEVEGGKEGSVEAQIPDVKPPSERLPGDEAPASAESHTVKKTTTKPRKAMKVPDTVHVKITKDNLKEYVGPAVYHKDRLYVKAPPAGVSTGLGYLGNGSGAVMPIEATSMPGKGNLQLTGKLGEVIRESAQIALSWVKSNAFALGITKSPSDMFLQDRDVHLHMPEGGIGKEGPSAGTALLSAFVSLFTKTRINPDIAMTGEITLLGQVLPVGGLKEKILAAHRAGIKKLIVPAACKSDIDENVPPSVKEGIEFVFVDDVRQVLHELFGKEPLQSALSEHLPLQDGEPFRQRH
ncbi:hypothetical protein NliqN6_3615 [Naganishia liquefaciens]|uniref:Lon protease homolog, mitochondrial n=1 Tax=Naganishia liquefaciens TaxID=104408 RepID=A0A8H3TUN3_9TREE|nr:hypothetical protein NliqN6_3615 [Naganishia liquefaciens]